MRIPEDELSGFNLCSRRVRGLDNLALHVSLVLICVHEETRQVGRVVVSFT